MDIFKLYVILYAKFSRPYVYSLPYIYSGLEYLCIFLPYQYDTVFSFCLENSGGRPPPNNIPRNSSPLMMASGPYRPPNSGSPMGPMPSLHPRPLLGGPPSGTPAVTGPVSEQLNKVAGKLVDFMRGTLEELFRELSTQVS